MAAWTLGDCLTSARARLDEPSERRFLSSNLRIWANEAQRDIARRVPHEMIKANVSASAGTQQYNFPTGCMEVYTVSYKHAGETNTYRLQFVNYKALSAQSYTWLETSQGRPQVWWWEGAPGTSSFKLNAFPIPADSGTFVVRYWGVPTDFATDGTDDANELTVAEGFDTLVVDYMVYRAHLADGNLQQYQIEKESYETTLQRLAEVAHQYTDEPNFVISDGGNLVPSYLWGGASDGEDW